MINGDTLTLLRAKKLLAKIWTADGTVIPSARSSWFECKEIQISSVYDIFKIIQFVQNRRRIAIVKERMASGVNPYRLRRTCKDGINKFQKPYKADLTEVPRCWVVLDIEHLPRPAHIAFNDGLKLAEYARNLLPPIFSNARCVWQLSGRSGHPSHREEIRLHLYFFLDRPIEAFAWKNYFRGSKFLDLGIYDKSKLIFTAAPYIHSGLDPIEHRVGMLDGQLIVNTSEVIMKKHFSKKWTSLKSHTHIKLSNVEPMITEANAFISVISQSNILRSQHPSYDGNRNRRLEFCSVVKNTFGVWDEAFLTSAFMNSCIGDSDQYQCSDASEASPGPGTRPRQDGTSRRENSYATPRGLYVKAATKRLEPPLVWPSPLI